MGVHFVHVITEEEEKQGAKMLGGLVALFFAAVAVYFAVVYWQVTLVVIGVLVLVGVLSAVVKRLDRRRS